VSLVNIYVHFGAPCCLNLQCPRKVSNYFERYQLDFRRGVVEAFALLRCYIAYVGSSLLTFRDNLSVPVSAVKQYKTAK
jgi:hypothetical protein